MAVEAEGKKDCPVCGAKMELKANTVVLYPGRVSSTAYWWDCVGCGYDAPEPEWVK